MTDMPTLVLIHGAGLGARDWRLVTPHLTQSYLAIDFPERGAKKPLTNLRLSDYRDELQTQLEEAHDQELILVGHSIGALVLMETAVKLGSRVKGFVAIGSVLPNVGASYVSSLPFGQRLLLSLIIRILGTKPPDKIIISDLCAGVDDELSTDVAKHFTAESRHLFTDQVTAKAPAVKSLFIQLMNDRTVKPALQAQMAERLKNSTIAKMNTGHMPMLESPQKLAEILNNFATQFDK